jgi:Fe-Mn family superoxide dismutase
MTTEMFTARSRRAVWLALLMVLPSPAHAFWVVNFGPAGTLQPGKIGFAAGIGGQMVFVGEPRQANGFFLIPHAGLRVGVAERLDMGWRLAPVPLPYSSVGPGFGANLDLKIRLTPRDASVQLALIAGAGGAHVLLRDDHRAAWSPNGAGLVTFHVGETTRLTFMARYVYLSIPTAPGGGSQNFVHIAGSSAGLKLDLTKSVALLPEVGGYWYEGRIAEKRTSGPGFQYGLMLGTSFLCCDRMTHLRCRYPHDLARLNGMTQGIFMTPAPPSRRELLGGLAALGASTVSCGTPRAAQAKPPEAPAAPPAPPPPLALAGKHAPLPLPFKPGALQGLSERMITSHHENNYAGAVKNLNRVEQELSAIKAETPPFVVVALRERELTFRNSKGLHEAYFGNLGGDGKRAGAIEAALGQAYGAASAWETQFRATGLGLGGGSGWVILALELDTGALRTFASAGHPQQLATSVPLLVLDMYEHSYQIDYGASHARYIDAFFANVNWDEVNRRFERAQRAVAALRG